MSLRAYQERAIERAAQQRNASDKRAPVLKHVSYRRQQVPSAWESQWLRYDVLSAPPSRRSCLWICLWAQTVRRVACCRRRLVRRWRAISRGPREVASLVCATTCIY